MTPPEVDLSGNAAATLAAVGRADAAAVAAYDRPSWAALLEAAGRRWGRRAAGRVRMLLRQARRRVGG